MELSQVLFTICRCKEWSANWSKGNYTFGKLSLKNQLEYIMYVTNVLKSIRRQTDDRLGPRAYAGLDDDF